MGIPPRHQHVLALAAVALTAAASCGPAPERAPVRRFVEEQVGAAPATLALDHTIVRVLDPQNPVQTFPLDAPGRASVFHAMIGVDPAAADARVLFEVTLDAPGAPSLPLLRKEIATGSWQDQRVPVPAAAEGSALTLRRTVAAGAPSALSLSAWGNPMLGPAEPSSEPDAPNVILVSLDTLRPDRLGCYGNASGATPALDRFAAEGTLFERAYSPSSWTLPSHRSILSGTFPLTPDVPSEMPLPRLLQREGYLTAGFTGGGFMSEFFGFDVGFDRYYSYPGGTPGPKCPEDRFDGNEVFGRAREWLRAHQGDRTFLFLHTYDVHDTCLFQVEGAAAMMRRPNPGPEARAREVAYYNGLVARLDVLFSRFLDDLQQLGLERNTLVVVTADHGEGFWEHGFDGHGKGRKPYDEMARVPLVMRWPSGLGSGVRVPQPVTNMAIAPTILALVGAPVPRSTLDAGPLPGLGLRPGVVDALAERAFEATQGGTLREDGPPASWLLDPPVYTHEGNLLGVRTARYKLITSKVDPAQTRVYDLAADPGETLNLVGRDAALDARLARLADAYWKRLASVPTAAPAPLDEKTRERLKALGYVD